LLREVPGEWEVHTVDLDPPQDNEVLLRIVASGLCHSDDNFASGAMAVPRLPFAGGHEASGVVEAVGAGVRSLSVGDHIVTSFVPICGRCRWCASGRQNLCDNQAQMMEGTQLDGTYRMHLDGEDVAQEVMLGAFAELTVVPEVSCIKIDPEIPLDVAALLGCAVPTGWGSAVNAAEVSPGDVVIVIGVGGVGMSAVQGASHAGATRIIAVDTVDSKRNLALEFGATDAIGDLEEAAELARSLTNGNGADAAIVCVGVVTGDLVAAAFAAVGKGGKVVVPGAAPEAEAHLPVSLLEMIITEKRIQGTLYGMTSPTRDVPRLLGLWQSGQLKLEEMATKTYPLEEINQGYDDLHAGVNLRGVLQLA
jgi:S-(hydroxymethyl)glutathione dehydrogenase/alcohol dehydrogenase